MFKGTSVCPELHTQYNTNVLSILTVSRTIDCFTFTCTLPTCSLQPAVCPVSTYVHLPRCHYQHSTVVFHLPGCHCQASFDCLPPSCVSLPISFDCLLLCLKDSENHSNSPMFMSTVSQLYMHVPIASCVILAP